MKYEFFAPQRIVFGCGRRTEVGSLAAELGRRAYLVSGSRTLENDGQIAAIVEACQAGNVECKHVTTISHEPVVRDVDETVKALKKLGASADDVLIAVGGGSAIDLAKACSAMLTNTEGDSVQDYLEGVGRGLTIQQAPLPLMAMPTTAGTGTEATKNAVISSFDPPFKKSLRSNQMVPKIVLIDPELSVSVPPTTTAYTGMDAITQLIESYISGRAQPIPQALCLQGLELAIPAIVEAVEHGESRNARERMAHAALLSGMALANSGLGFAHGVAPALGVHAKVPHGLACAVMLPWALKVNREVRLVEIARIGRLIADLATTTELEFVSDEMLGCLQGDDADALANFAIESIDALCRRINIPTKLTEIGVQPNQIAGIVKSARGNSMSANPRHVDDDELTSLLEGLL